MIQFILYCDRYFLMDQKSQFLLGQPACIKFSLMLILKYFLYTSHSKETFLHKLIRNLEY